MSSEKTSAIVLRVIEFSETSSVVRLFTRDFGKIDALAKGARRPKGPFESALDLLAFCRVVFLRKSSDALHLLTEARLQRRFRFRDLPSLYAGYYVAELLNELTDEEDPHPELFDAADATLVALTGECSVAALVLRFELTALRIVGHLPSFDSCVECGKSVEAVGQMHVGLLSGGVLCAQCRPGKKQVVELPAGSLRTLAQFADPTRSAWQRLELDPRTAGAVRGMMSRYIANLLGRPARMHSYLRNLPT